jgi:hypothetical protein
MSAFKRLIPFVHALIVNDYGFRSPQMTEHSVH